MGTLSDIFLLGAGFSKSISASMPTLRDLGELALRDSRLEAAQEDPRLLKAFEDHDETGAVTPLVDIEQLMTFLSQDQPFLSPEENALNRSRFLRIAKGLAAILTEIEGAVTNVSPPEWLLPLIRRWEKNKTTVATFNYDTLIERGYLAVLHEDGERGQEDRKHKNHRSIYAAATQPARARRGFTWSEGGGDAFAYLKMHGSLNWFYSGAPSSYGEPVYDLDLPRWGDEHTPEEIKVLVDKEVRTYVPDKFPLVIPPTTEKSAWFKNELIRGQWLTLGDSLRDAERLIAIGYSLPHTDSMVHALLATTCVDRRVVVVNSSEAAPGHYARLLPGALIDDEYAGVPNAIELFASHYTR